MATDAATPRTVVRFTTRLTSLRLPPVFVLAPVLALVLAGALTLGAIPASATVADDLLLVNRAAGLNGVAADDDSRDASISADGRYVAFSSDANNLSDEDDDFTTNIFVRDLVSGATTLVSRADGPGGYRADADSYDASISADGRYVAFNSYAENLSDEDTDPAEDVFVRDLVNGATTFVSRADGPGGVGADSGAYDPSISADGRHVAFASDADNLSDEDEDATTDVFVRDVAGGATTFVSRADGTGGVGADSGAYDPSISADGRYVAFASDASNLYGDDDNATADIFIRDVADDATTLVSRVAGLGGAVGDARSEEPSISADGRYVAFGSNADNLSDEDDDLTENVFVRDLVSRATTLVSRAAGIGGPAADSDSDDPSISADGRYVAFRSYADNLSSEDDDSNRGIFVRDRAGGATTLVSRTAGPGGPAAEGDSQDPSISADGRYVAFRSYADNLSGEDDDDQLNVFVRDVLGLPTVPGPVPAPAPAKCNLLVKRLPQISFTKRHAAKLRLHATSGTCAVKITYKLTITKARRAYKFKGRALTLAGGASATRKIAFDARATKLIKAALKRRRKVMLTTTITATGGGSEVKILKTKMLR